MCILGWRIRWFGGDHEIPQVKWCADTSIQGAYVFAILHRMEHDTHLRSSWAHSWPWHLFASIQSYKRH